MDSSVYILYLCVITCFLLVQVSFCHVCTFDKIQTRSLLCPKTHIAYGHISSRSVRSVNDQFSPIRIYVYYQNQTDLIPEELLRLQDIVQQAVQRIKSLLSVIPVVDSLLLQRKAACGKKHVTGPNIGKCAQLKRGYGGEYCLNEIDSFKIPDAHLLGQDVFSSSDPLPLSSSIGNGTGVSDADYILYIAATHSRWCLEQNLAAYASYCQLDQHDRPIAGFVNFCPTYFQESDFNIAHAIQAAIHEIFHALGFSGDLYDKYKDCQEIRPGRRECYRRRRPYQLDEGGGGMRMHLPAVIQEADRHFGCTRGLGVPLQKIGYGVSSHWDPLVMHSSIMAPTLKEPTSVSIDPITLALFADTGWYHVNMSGADHYSWAKDGGCEFLRNPQCSNYPFLCNVSECAEPGCLQSPNETGRCVQVSNYHQCGIWQQNITVSANAVSRMPRTPQIKVYTTEGYPPPEPVSNHTWIRFLVLVPHPKGRSHVNVTSLEYHILQKLLSQVCVPSHWIMNFTLSPASSNDSYWFDLFLSQDLNTSKEEESQSIMEKLLFLSQYGNFTLSSTEIIPFVHKPSGRAYDYLKGWQALVVLAAIFISCVITGALIVIFIEIKGNVWQALTHLPSRIR